MMIHSQTKYLLHFVHENLTFRWPEFLSITLKHSCKFNLISDKAQINKTPYLIIELQDGVPEQRLIDSVRESYLLKGVFELWAGPSSSLDELEAQASQSVHFLSNLYSPVEQTFRVNCESFRVKLSQTQKIEWIKKLTFLDSFDARPNLKNPRQVYSIFECNDKATDNHIVSREYYFGRRLSVGDRDVIENFSLKERKFIANTTMDPMLSLVSANLALVKPADLVYDPFAGSGGLLVAAAHKGAYVAGSDIDWKLVHGKSKPSRKGQVIRLDGESVKANLIQYNMQDRFLDILVGDISRAAFSKSFLLDSIISDPPYGVRECSEKIGSRKEPKKPRDYKVVYPSKTSYYMEELLTDLLGLSAKHLKMNGRLVYFLPVIKCARDYQEFIPSHPCLKLISSSEQDLTTKISRLLVVMEKIKEPAKTDQVTIPDIINSVNFRETYFSRSDDQ